MSNTFAIERLASREADRLRALRLRALRDDPAAFGTAYADAEKWDAEVWELQLKMMATFVAPIDARDVGLVRGVPSETEKRTCDLISLWVEPGSRRQGVAAALVGAVVAWATAEGRDTIVVEVNEANEPAIALYRRLGFAATGKRGAMPPPRQHIREIQMVLRI